MRDSLFARSKSSIATVIRSLILLRCFLRAPCFDAQDFKSATTGVAAKAMRNELNKMVAAIEDPVARKVR